MQVQKHNWQSSTKGLTPISTPTIRNGTADDATELLTVHRESILQLGVSAYTFEECESWAAGLTIQGYADAMSKGGETYFITEQDDRLTGFTSFKGDEIIGLYVHPEFSGNGIGTLLLDAAEKQIAKTGHKSVKLDAALSAEKFYLARGYTCLGKLAWKTRGLLEIEICRMVRHLDNPSPAEADRG